MDKQKLLDLGLTEEQAEKVLAENKTQLLGFIPKIRFDQVNTAKGQLEKDIAERDSQLKTLKDSAGDNEQLKNDIIKLQNDNKAATEKYNADIKALKLDSTIDTALAGHKAKNIKAVKGLLDISKISLDGENLLGLDDQLKTLKEAEDSKFLFDVETKAPEVTPPAGTSPGASNVNNPANASKSLADAIAGAINL